MEKKIAIVLAVNEKYLPGLLVCVKSLRAHDCAFPVIVYFNGDIENPHAKLIQEERNVTMIPFCGDPAIGRLDMFTCKLKITLQYEKILYLDADVLVRDDLGKLISTDMDHKTVAAIRDVGEPMGSSIFPRPESYFNAGVLLLDVQKIMYERENFEKFLQNSPDPQTLVYQDQDILNQFFKGRWKELPLCWNMQGIGSYAQYRTYSESQWKPCLYSKQELYDHVYNSKIVHFTSSPKPWEIVQKDDNPAHENPFQAEWIHYASQTGLTSKYQLGPNTIPINKTGFFFPAGNSWAIVVPIQHPEDFKSFSALHATSFPAGTTLFMVLDFPSSANLIPESLKKKYNVITYQFAATRPFQIWPIYNCIVREAVKHSFKYFLLFGDDLEIDTGAFEEVEKEFQKSEMLGCVAIWDRSSPGFPSFPVVTYRHVEMFQGFCFSVFVNQDADPWVWSIYRRFGLSRFTHSGLTNIVGGANGNPRYTRVHVLWKEEILKKAIRKVQQKQFIRTVPTIDVVIPCYRCDIEILENIINLRQRGSLAHFIIIVDNISISDEKIKALKRLEECHKSSVRVRFNEKNLGASASRNRGIEESSADWILFLDDDVIPDKEILNKYFQRIEEAGSEACGFVGISKFPPFTSFRHRAFHLSHIGYFWGVASFCKRPPWGVTANLLLKRVPQLKFRDTVKTGGGEDIAICIDIKNMTCKPLLAAPEAVILHPWWNNGCFNPFRFFLWTTGDKYLWRWYPEYTYYDWPNAIETILTGSSAFVCKWIIKSEYLSVLGFLSMCACVFIFSIYVILLQIASVEFIASEITHPSLLDKFGATLLRLVVEFGHLWSTKAPLKRFDWWLHTNEKSKRQEIRLKAQQFYVNLIVLLAILYY